MKANKELLSSYNQLTGMEANFKGMTPDERCCTMARLMRKAERLRLKAQRLRREAEIKLVRVAETEKEMVRLTFVQDLEQAL